MRKIYNLATKVSLVLSNYLDLSSKIFKFENEIGKNNIPDNSQFQYDLFALDILINSKLEPYLSDIVINPLFGLVDASQKIIRERVRIYNDLIENYVVEFYKSGTINYDSSDFVVLNKVPAETKYKWVVGKKLESKTEDNFDQSYENNKAISHSGESLIQNVILRNKNNLTNDNQSLNMRLSITHPDNDVILGEGGIINIANTLGQEKSVFDLTEKSGKLIDDNIAGKINSLNTINEDSPKNKIVNFMKKTIPIMGIAYAAKKTYNTIKGNEKINSKSKYSLKK